MNMIIYSSTKAGFQFEIEKGEIDIIIGSAFKEKLHRDVLSKEADSWWNSMQFMYGILSDKDIPADAGITIECQIPQTSKRIDFIISGCDEYGKDNAVIIELKQWKNAELTDKDGIVRTALGKGIRDTNHPSYQAWSYAAVLQDFSVTVQNEDIGLRPCAYLHNYEDDGVIRNPFYKEYIDKAPVFLKRDNTQLRNFIKKYVKKGDKGEIMYRIDTGKIKPSKKLSDSLASLLKGNHEFIMLDEQKIVFETALQLMRKTKSGVKQVLIVNGGPGTGKSVVAINLLVEMIKLGRLVQYTTKNAAPRAVYQSKLAGTLKKTRFSSLFQSSGVYFESQMNEFDALIVDEAHRLNAKSGMFQNIGENQVKEIIQAAKCSIFFLDEDQKISIKDIGTKDEVRIHAKNAGATVHEMELSSQFRCNGSDAYLVFLDHLLQLRDTANPDISNLNYDFQVCDSVDQLRNVIFEKNNENNSARLVAGYCWDWISKNNPKLKDINFPESNFSMRWNLNVDSMLWMLKPNSVNEVGCIHTCQGLELDYIGVIIGTDLIVRNGKIHVDPLKRSRMDSSIKGYKQLLKKKPDDAKDLIRKIIKNTYRTLMTRGIKGCYIWAEDMETNQWLKEVVTQ
jgi:DUF2075 family protein